MAENNQNQPAPDVIVESGEEPNEPTRLQKFVIKHPRASKVVAITGGILAAGGVALTANNMRKNKHELNAAADHAKAALSGVSSSVSPDPADTEA